MEADAERTRRHCWHKEKVSFFLNRITTVKIRENSLIYF